MTLPVDVQPKSEVDLEIGYEGTIPLDGTRLARIGVPADVARHSDWDQIGKTFTAVRGIGYVAWYPVATESANLSEGNSVLETVARWKAREQQSDMKIKLSNSGEGAPALLLCNGDAGGSRPGEPTGRADENVIECAFHPVGQKVPLFVIGAFDALDQPPVNISYLQDHKAAAETYALAARLVAPFVSEWFGTMRGRTEVRAKVVELNDPEAAPYESGSMLLTPLNNDSTLARLTAVHQLTHAAFFSARPWIYEGLAHFAQAAYMERERGRQAALDFMGLHRSALAEAERALQETRARNAGTDESLIRTSIEDLYRSKALYVWWMLREMIGEDALKKALAAYRPEDDTTPAYMQHLIEAQIKGTQIPKSQASEPQIADSPGKKLQSDAGLQWFFDDWVYHDRGLPDIRLPAVYPWVSAGSAHVVTATLENLGNAGAEIAVILRMDEGEVIKRVQVGAKSKVTIRIEAASTPREIVVNDGGVPESDMSNNVYKIDAPVKRN